MDTSLYQEDEKRDLTILRTFWFFFPANFLLPILSSEGGGQFFLSVSRSERNYIFINGPAENHFSLLKAGKAYVPPKIPRNFLVLFISKKINCMSCYFDFVIYFGSLVKRIPLTVECIKKRVGNWWWSRDCPILVRQCC